jgi:CheY-like chemotaxis protein
MDGDHSILIVEDDVDLREMLAVVLQGEGYSVLEASHGGDALAKLSAPTGVCLIVLDLFMPTMNGWAFREAQMKDPAIAEIPVVVVSADAAAARRAGSELGVAETMTKPIDFDRFLRVVDRYC